MLLVTKEDEYVTWDKQNNKQIGQYGECFRCNQLIGEPHKETCSNVLFPSLRIHHSNPHGWIQWKGTNVCIDIRCDCGELGHIDGNSMYHIKCKKLWTSL